MRKKLSTKTIKTFKTKLKQKNNDFLHLSEQPTQRQTDDKQRDRQPDRDSLADRDGDASGLLAISHVQERLCKGLFDSFDQLFGQLLVISRTCFQSKPFLRQSKGLMNRSFVEFCVQVYDIYSKLLWICVVTCLDCSHKFVWNCLGIVQDMFRNCSVRFQYFHYLFMTMTLFNAFNMPLNAF